MDAILTFHAIGSQPSPLCFPADRLRSLVERLLDNGVRFASIGELLDAAPEQGDRVALTFDDGLRSVHAHALPLLERLGIPAAVYVVSGWVGRHNDWPTQTAGTPRLPLMGWSELAELRSAGFEIGSHGVEHRPLPGLAEADLRAELQGSRRALEDRLGAPVEHFAYPYGGHDATCVERARSVYRSAVTTRMAFSTPAADPLRLPRLDAYYLRRRTGRPLFGLGSRAYLGLRAFLRRLRRGGGD